MKKITFAMVIITIALSFGMNLFSDPLLANTESHKTENRGDFLNILTVNKPQYDMVKKIVKDKNNVEYMLTNEKDISEFKYNEDVLNNISNMDLFIYSGTSFEPWSNSLIDELKKGDLGIINLSRGIRLLNYSQNNSNKENPYYFEGISEYKIALCNVKSAIQDRDPQNRDYYEENYNEAIKEFDNKIKIYNDKIKSLSDYKFITLNNDFDYLTKALNLNTIQLDNHEIADFIKLNNLDAKKVIIIVDGEAGTKLNLSGYNTVNLWKYYGDMSFDDLILYNIKELSKWAPLKENGTVNSTGKVA
ncbi:MULTISPECIES: metal ABC transporter substrate-binding protein [Clostridium]|uniref:ABC-type metal ion transport system, periplasmic component/surface adhesin n=1 Tax=Clostridium saccharoperbutylacetonicum N1-4(HMT) TaxID=931276 RepID=M1LNT9_9CLOT|nr:MULTISPECIES: zinc ABC transporter substrate-binding protein [Clostridium]AGF54505.1 ABC-type metal ion transport system, periplasmic component/surface adhesin [Clostridium saccharoperbutylacetonicum N1-4(HMT)]NRT58975.1 ABC-type Zn uptake system ZnuABC Zn-binding protein ZnuA [Clostridium saccharoperbutylacetonicum]NSB28163.1 ABC-type Zn uptake system ZnuABC Zn-binding protein ZnuA [Clostridium saccharoperbutylacetonicum]NSB41651.1 ABC-type Zn uptake system ZnuABC Zn-binding protein ZnuA [C